MNEEEKYIVVIRNSQLDQQWEIQIEKLLIWESEESKGAELNSKNNYHKKYVQLQGIHFAPHVWSSCTNV